MGHLVRFRHTLGGILAVLVSATVGWGTTAMAVTAQEVKTATSTPRATRDPVCESGCTPLCVGDCNGDGEVVVNELVKAVNIALGTTELGECTAADGSADGAVTVNELVTAVRNALEGCPTNAALGERRFSLNPDTSGFSIEGFPFPLAGTGFTGYIELEAGVPDAETGLAEVNITDASEYISMLLKPFAGVEMAICLRPVRELLPVANAGTIACNGGYDFGLVVTQDHNVGVVGVDGFTEQDCIDAEGTVEPQDGAHPGVCNGPIVSEGGDSDSGPGALLIAPDPETLEGGLPVMMAIEDALPCGDEAVEETQVPLGFTTGIVRATIFNRNNVAGEVFQIERQGENFSCAEWTVENGPGTLVLAAPVIDQGPVLKDFFDVANVFVLDD
jgi:hypothetical protein